MRTIVATCEPTTCFQTTAMVPVVVVVVALSRRMRHGGDEAVVPPRTPHISGLVWIR